MESIPFIHEKKLFDRLLASVTSYTNLSEVDRRAYDADLQAYRDAVNQIDSARQEGMEKRMRQGMRQGKEEGLLQGMQKGIERGIEVEKENTVMALGRINMALNQIAEVTGLTIEKIKNILSK